MQSVFRQEIGTTQPSHTALHQSSASTLWTRAAGGAKDSLYDWLAKQQDEPPPSGGMQVRWVYYTAFPPALGNGEVQSAGPSHRRPAKFCSEVKMFSSSRKIEKKSLWLFQSFAGSF